MFSSNPVHNIFKIDTFVHKFTINFKIIKIKAAILDHF